jgi:Gram-negative bacterial TonB protein C-terminal
MAQDGAPQFPSNRESQDKALGNALVALDTLAALSTKNVTVQPSRVERSKAISAKAMPAEVILEGPKRSSAFFTSLLLHFAVMFFLLRVPFSIFLHHHQSQSLQLPQIVYEFHEIVLPHDLPALKPPGPGGQPGKGTHPDEAPARGSLAFHPKATVVSNPPNPDNNEQTIIQPNVPHDVKIKMNLHLPDIIMGGVLPVQTPPPPTPPPPMKLSVPRTLQSLTIPQVAVVSPTPPDLIIPASSTPNLPPIPMPEPPPPPLVPKLAQSTIVTPIIPSTVGLVAEANGSSARLLVLSLNPAPPASSIAIPAGNRYGAFTISPAGNQPGSPSGVNGGTLNGGEGGPGSGGDNSTGVGSGHAGGGGNGGGKGGLGVSTSGNAASGGSGMAGSLAAAAAAKLVYPILRPPPKNRFAMVVTAGPAGGGGLHIYGVLAGGKVYTVFLPMPKRNWILQYCVLDGANNQDKKQDPNVSVALNFGIIPPDVEKRFDFHRPTLPPDQKNSMIVLHGIIDKDGAVENLRVYQGVQKVADLAAVAAFDQWKFKPALENGKAIAIEILLGIPVS